MDTDPSLTFRPGDAAWLVASYLYLAQRDMLSHDDQAVLAPYVERLQAQLPVELVDVAVGKPPIEHVA